MPAIMPSLTINGVRCEFSPGQTVLQAANAVGVEIPQYCYHDGLSVVASCRICLGEALAPDAKTGTLTPYMGGKLFPTCQTPAVDGMVVYTDSPKAVANQKAVMEYLLINHPLDCPVCDQSGECFLQDYSYMYGRGVSRFEEQKVKQPKKDVGPHVLLYSDRCIMCTRCVRFTREVTGTSELLVQGRGNKEEIDVFPGVPLANELSGNVIDLCPVGALLDKDFLFAQRVWFLKETPSIDPLTASGDNITIHHNQGEIYRVKPRTNLAVNKWWITDEVRYGWKFVHSDRRIASPMRNQYGSLVDCDDVRAYDEALDGLKAAPARGQRLALLVSPMLTCEEAFSLAKLAMMIDPEAIIGMGPVPMHGENKTFPIGAKPEDRIAFTVCAEKAPNARGVRRVLSCFGRVLEFGDWLSALRVGGHRGGVGSVLLTGNYPSTWVTEDLVRTLEGKFVTLIDTLRSELIGHANVVIPGATWAEKSGTFENHRGILQAFRQAIPTFALAKSEGQICADMMAVLAGSLASDATAARKGVAFRELQSTVGQVADGVQVALPVAQTFDPASVREEMAQAYPTLHVMRSVVEPAPATTRSSDMPVQEL